MPLENHKYAKSHFFIFLQRMESDEINALKRRYFDTRQQSRDAKARMRQQRERSRQLIAACAQKLQEKELQIETVRERYLCKARNKKSPFFFRSKLKEKKNYPSLREN